MRGIWSFLQTWWSAVSIDWCATCYTSPGGESMRRTLRRRPGFACCNGAASTTGGSGLIHGYSRSPAIWQWITRGKNEKRWQQYPCQMIAMQCCCYPLPILPIRSRGPKRRRNASGRPAADSATAVSRGFAAEVSRRPVSCGDGSGLGRPYYNGDVQNLSRSCSTEIRI